MSNAEWYNEFYARRAAYMPSWYQDILADLRSHDDWAGPLLELGCGRGELLLLLLRSGILSSGEIYAIEQSNTAIDGLRSTLPNVRQGDITKPLNFSADSFGVIVLAEVIEHLRSMTATLAEVRRVLRVSGRLYVSFPNYVNIPWLALRIASQTLRRPEWIVLQPVDHIYFFPTLRRRIESHGFRLTRASGSVFFPPLLYKREPGWFRAVMNAAGMQCFAFHPVMVFEKTR
ncbi:MAG: class I SAM-dependent methyltransferase [Candidatus Tyrphobacter sp.]